MERCLSFFFFFQAEDGIRDRNVTGVQTCALPISGALDGPAFALRPVARPGLSPAACPPSGSPLACPLTPGHSSPGVPGGKAVGVGEIGRASCRERGEIWGVAASLKEEVSRSDGEP